jgi:hypothetical protein
MKPEKQVEITTHYKSGNLGLYEGTSAHIS